jgi:hypothetical protein
MTDLERAYAALAGKAATYDALWDYYDGQQPLIYSAARLREIFKNINARFAENWCAVVIDAMLERIDLERFHVPGNEAAEKALNTIYEATQLDLDGEDAHLATLVTGEGFVIAWREAAGPITAYYNDPRLCAAFYDADQPRLLTYAAKWWIGDDDRRHITLYYADRLEYYVSRGKASDTSSAQSFISGELDRAVNPFGMIPVFHLRRTRRAIKSELQNVIEPQNAVNKLLADMMIAAEFGAMRQRYIISQSDPGDMANAPNINWWVPAGDGVGQQSTVGQFEATDLSNYLNAMDRITQALAIISRTPKHYFFAEGGDPSGEALMTMEAPLHHKCEKFIAALEPVWQQIGAFLLALDGQPVPASEIAPEFAEVRTVQPRTQAEIREINVRAGLPLVTQLRDEGWTPQELDELAQDQQAEGVASGALGAGLLTAFDRNVGG